MPQPKLNAIELTMWATLLASLVYAFAVARTEKRFEAFLALDHGELNALATRYGPSHNSLGPEEWILKDFFKGRRDGIFVEDSADVVTKGPAIPITSRRRWDGRGSRSSRR